MIGAGAGWRGDFEWGGELVGVVVAEWERGGGVLGGEGAEGAEVGEGVVVVMMGA